jgi:cell wall-associated NlpC family hydrolase
MSCMTLISANDFVNNALKVEFIEKGRSFSGWDCYGLVYCFYRNVYGKFLPTYDEGYEDTGNSRQSRKQINALMLDNKISWDKVDKPQEGDVVLFNLGGLPIHAGIMLDVRRFLHCERKRNTMIESVSSSMWKLRVEGFYRMISNGK